MRKVLIFTLLIINCLMSQTTQWDSIAYMNTSRWYHAAVELDNGEILVTGGYDFTGYETNSCEIYNSSTNSWRFTDTMSVKRVMHKLILLDDGRVLAIGGYNEPSCEIYNATTEKWTLTWSSKPDPNPLDSKWQIRAPDFPSLLSFLPPPSSSLFSVLSLLHPFLSFLGNMSSTGSGSWCEA